MEYSNATSLLSSSVMDSVFSGIKKRGNGESEGSEGGRERGGLLTFFYVDNARSIRKIEAFSKAIKFSLDVAK